MRLLVVWDQFQKPIDSWMELLVNRSAINRRNARKKPLKCMCGKCKICWQRKYRARRRKIGKDK